MTHLSEEQLFALADGGIAPNQEGVLRTHLERCADCRVSLHAVEQLADDLATPDELDEDAHVRGIMARLSNRDGTAKTTLEAAKPRGHRAWVAPAAAALAMAAATLLFVRSREQAPPDEFTARGTASDSTLARNVGVRVFAGAPRPAALERGSVVRPDTSFTGAYRNVHPHPAHLLLFAVDSAHTVHWLYPAYTRADENPSSILLERAEHERLLPTSVVLDVPAEGPLRIVAVTSATSLHVQDIEKRSPKALELGALQRDFPASISETIVEVRK